MIPIANDNAVQAARAGIDLAALVRRKADQRSIIDGLHRMMLAPASTPLDALAFATAAKSLMPVFTESCELDADDEGYVANTIHLLVNRMVETLEVATQTPSATFTGLGPAMN